MLLTKKMSQEWQAFNQDRKTYNPEVHFKLFDEKQHWYFYAIAFDGKETLWGWMPTDYGLQPCSYSVSTLRRSKVQLDTDFKPVRISKVIKEMWAIQKKYFSDCSY